MKTLLQNILRFLILLLVQVLIIDQLQLSIYCRPALYVYFFIALPVSIPRWAELFIGFFVGLTLDSFANTLGINMAASLLICYIRPLLIKAMISDENIVPGFAPSLRTFGTSLYIRFVSILVIIQHLLLFSIEAFSLVGWWNTLLRIIISSAVCIGIILIIEKMRKK